MKTITLAIPFYNTSKYFLDAIQYAIDDNFVSEISITDDCSTDAEWEKLNSIISTLDTNKIKVYRNDENLKPFRNKYNAVMNSTNEWVYLLDSDNHMLENSIELLKTIPDDDPTMTATEPFSRMPCVSLAAACRWIPRGIRHRKMR